MGNAAGLAVIGVLVVAAWTGVAAYGGALRIGEPASAQGLLGLLEPYPRGANPSACAQSSPAAGDIPRSYGWNFDGKAWCFTATFSNASEAGYRQGSHLAYDVQDTFVPFVEDARDDAWIQDLVARFDAAAQSEQMGPQQEVEFVMTFVQSLPYTSDQVTTGADNYVRYPVQTLIERGGDCEDTGILLAALLKEMGHDVVLLMPPNHLAVGVAVDDDFAKTHATIEHAGKHYAYIETTGDRWEFGQIPPELQGQPVRVFET